MKSLTPYVYFYRDILSLFFGSPVNGIKELFTLLLFYYLI